VFSELIFPLGLRPNFLSRHTFHPPNKYWHSKLVLQNIILTSRHPSVVDDSSRGYILELMATKLLSLEQNLQLIGMSATLTVGYSPVLLICY
jgi:hypothetical protein